MQNDLLHALRLGWRKVGFLYLCAMLNNCMRCVDLWQAALGTCSGAKGHGGALRPPLLDHVGPATAVVADGFRNLARCVGRCFIISPVNPFCPDVRP